MFWNKSKKQTNRDKCSELNNDKLAEFMGNEIYTIFRFSLTKKEFVEKLEGWLNAKVEPKDTKKNDKLYDYDVRA